MKSTLLSIFVSAFLLVSTGAFASEAGTCEVLRDERGLPIFDASGEAQLDERTDACNYEAGYFPSIHELECACQKLEEK